MEALNDLVRSGKVRYIGASSMYAWQFAKAQHIAEKNEEREMNPLCIDQGVALIPWSPLARGFLSGNRSKVDINQENNSSIPPTKRAQSDIINNRMPYTDNDFEIVERLKIVAEKKQIKPAQLALARILAKPDVISPIIGASKIYQLEEAVEATNIQLSNEDIQSLEELYQPHRIRGHS